MFCPVPVVLFVTNNETCNPEPHITNFYLDDCAHFCVKVLTTLSGSELVGEQLSFIRQVDSKTRRLLEDTALLDELCIAYCYLKHHFMWEVLSGFTFLAFHNLEYLSPVLAIIRRSLDKCVSKFCFLLEIVNIPYLGQLRYIIGHSQDTSPRTYAPCIDITEQF